MADLGFYLLREGRGAGVSRPSQILKPSPPLPIKEKGKAYASPRSSYPFCSTSILLSLPSTCIYIPRMPEVKTRSWAVNHRTLWSIIPIGGRNKATKPMIRAAMNATIDIIDLILIIEWIIKNLRVYLNSLHISIISYCYPTYLPITRHTNSWVVYLNLCI